MLTIPYSLMTEFQTRVIAPWHAAWKHFRSSRQRGGASESDPNAALPAMAPPAEGGTAGASAEEELESGDTLFTWGCLDWSTSNLSNLTPKNRERAAFIVPHPDLLAVPPGLEGKRIAMVAAGARHNLLVTHDGECFAWGRGTAGQLGSVALGCTSHPLQLRMLSLGKHVVTAVSCGAEHSCVLLAGGELYTFGSGKRGQTGLGTNDTTTVPQRAMWNKKLCQEAASVSAGAMHTAVVCATARCSRAARAIRGCSVRAARAATAT